MIRSRHASRSSRQVPRHLDAGAVQPCDEHRRGVLKDVDAGVQLHRFPIREALGAIELPRRRQHGADQALDVRHQRMMVVAHAVPLDHRELGVVPAAALAVAIDLADLPDVAAARGEQALHRVLGRGLQEAAASAGDRLDAREVHVGHRGCAECRRFDFERASRGEIFARCAQHRCSHFERGDGCRRPPAHVHHRAADAVGPAAPSTRRPAWTPT